MSQTAAERLRDALTKAHGESSGKRASDRLILRRQTIPVLELTPDESPNKSAAPPLQDSQETERPSGYKDQPKDRTEP